VCSVAPGRVKNIGLSTELAGTNQTRVVTDLSTLKWLQLLAPNSDFNDLGHFGKLTQRVTHPT
jgi:hypothetical protein